MKKLDIDLGLEEYQINDAVIKLNPTDTVFLERLSTAISKMEGLQDRLQGQIQAAKDDVARYETFKQVKKEMEKVIDNLFERPGINKEIFCGVSPYAIGSNAFPVWVNVLVPLAAEIDEVFETAGDENNPKLQAYINKYSKIFDM